MDILNVWEAKASLNQLVSRVLAGESVAIGRWGEPEVVLSVYARGFQPRELGVVDSEEYWFGEDFNDPLPEAEAGFAAWSGSE